ncbi:MAG: SIS domain-containing protein [Nitrosomonadales bacterium]|nr:SIS domain-containing protein [Nitrosomonadales bacterium]
MQERILAQIRESASVVALMTEDHKLLLTVQAVVEACVTALKNGNKLLFMGNGGSAADSQHLAGEMVSRFAFNRPGLPAFALTVDSSVMTAIGNDFGYEQLFSRQIEAVARPGDVLFGISTSGRSPNILAGLDTAGNMGLVTVGMSGNQKARITEMVDHCIEIPSDSTPKIQEGHIIIGHIICGLVEQQMFSALH